MIKIITVGKDNKITLTAQEIEKMLKEAYNAGRNENWQRAYDKGYKDGYCSGRNGYWYNGITCTDSLSTDLTNTVTTNTTTPELTIKYQEGSNCVDGDICINSEDAKTTCYGLY